MANTFDQNDDLDGTSGNSQSDATATSQAVKKLRGRMNAGGQGSLVPPRSQPGGGGGIPRGNPVGGLPGVGMGGPGPGMTAGGGGAGASTGFQGAGPSGAAGAGPQGTGSMAPQGNTFAPNFMAAMGASGANPSSFSAFSGGSGGGIQSAAPTPMAGMGTGGGYGVPGTSMSMPRTPAAPGAPTGAPVGGLPTMPSGQFPIAHPATGIQSPQPAQAAPGALGPIHVGYPATNLQPPGASPQIQNPIGAQPIAGGLGGQMASLLRPVGGPAPGPQFQSPMGAQPIGQIGQPPRPGTANVLHPAAGIQQPIGNMPKMF
jgi:hypothetical protein